MWVEAIWDTIFQLSSTVRAVSSVSASVHCPYSLGKLA